MPQKNVVSLLLVAVIAVFCWQAAQSAPREDQDAELYRLFVDAFEHVDRNYVKGVDRRKLMEAAINGMLGELDPYSNFIDQSHYRQFDRQTSGQFGGIGIQISEKDGILTVISPLVGTPAYEAGVLAGDRILEVNGESIRGMPLRDVVSRLTGPEGTDVTLSIQHRPYDKEPKEVTLKRAIINIESVLGDSHDKNDAWDFMLDDDNKIAYIRLNAFTKQTAEDLTEALKELEAEGMKGLVLDLRYNPGGLLESAIQISDLFVDEGKIVSTKGRNTIERKFFAKKDGTLDEFPMVVLVNSSSASASEIVAACLQDHQRAIVVGERTWGKGSVQNVIELEGGKSALKLTTASYRRPNGKNIHRFPDSDEEDEWGVSPNDGFLVEFSPEEHRSYFRDRQKRDRVLGKRSELIKANGDDGNAKEEDNGDDEAKPFEDRQLKKALSYIREQLGEEKGKDGAPKEEATDKADTEKKDAEATADAAETD
ncbi:Carboxy-terminal processing protease CtpA precursor [Planctomycetes bacterium Pan216]|uniref:Carboxy-terminal processing protease CtpA n=1 Tax=Kolteria novifilia TaxID=2527975 RepID=A0A518BD53_9BACT|nr:Carboxy-terminal processing protease CtpA precursor [Planctomycetes bacterium Pan216]